MGFSIVTINSVPDCDFEWGGGVCGSGVHCSDPNSLEKLRPSITRTERWQSGRTHYSPGTCRLCDRRERSQFEHMIINRETKPQILLLRSGIDQVISSKLNLLIKCILHNPHLHNHSHNHISTTMF